MVCYLFCESFRLLAEGIEGAGNQGNGGEKDHKNEEAAVDGGGVEKDGEAEEFAGSNKRHLAGHSRDLPLALN